MLMNPADSFSVADQIVLISGGSRGIGRAIAQGFVSGGAYVVVSSRSENSLAEARQALSGGHPVTTHVCDVAKPDDIEALTTNVIREFGRIDTLINVAGVNRRKPALEITSEDYDFIMDINLKGAWLLSREVGRHQVETGKGTQINIASLNNDKPLLNVAPYAMSKAALGQMTRGLAAEWGPSGVRVNAIAPGFVITDLTRKLWSLPTMQDWVMPNTPLRRLGQPEDLVGAALFLASGASAWMTGQILYVDGGFTAAFNWPIPTDGGQ